MMKRSSMKRYTSEGWIMSISDELKLVSYCGVYCGACAPCSGRWRKAAKELLNLMKAYPPMPWEGKVPFKYEEFKKGLNWLYKKRWVCPGCRAGGGRPYCEIRRCVQGKKINFCYECNDFPCQKLFDIQVEHPDNIENIKKMMKIGVKNWLLEQKRKTEEGYDIHMKES
jgi:hypothetical protein